jgi:GH24 family phage-related lysozyme (muramidase)/murein DD-endopeptidase MepM/ murein hydrolase activator NlpD
LSRVDVGPVTPEAWLAQLHEMTISDAAKNGEIAPSTGVTKSTGPVPKTVEEHFEKVSNLRQDWERRNGPGVKDGPELTNHTGNYSNRLFDYIKDREGERLESYKDHKGLTTVGVGFNMDAEGARDRFEQVLPTVDFDAVYSGEVDLLPSQSRALFDGTIGTYESIVSRKIGDAPLSENQRIALTSLAFNSPSLIGDNLTKFVQEGRHIAAANEIKNRSNKNRHPGIQNRRDVEAQTYLGSEQFAEFLELDIGGVESSEVLSMSVGKGTEALDRYVVQQGDSLSEIAERFGTDINTLVNLNKIKDPNMIRVGQQIITQAMIAEVPELDTIDRTLNEDIDVDTDFMISAEAEEMNRSKFGIPPRKPNKETEGPKGNFFSSIVPTHVHAFVSHLVGLDATELRDEEYFKTEERQAITTVVQRAAKRFGIDLTPSKKWHDVDYDLDYTTGQSDVSHSSSKLFGDAEFSIKTTLGNFAWRVDERGHLLVKDKYDFNDAKRVQQANPSFIDKAWLMSKAVGRVVTRGAGLYHIARMAGAAYGSTDGSGATFELDLGPL